MILLDVNLLLNAYNIAAPRHAAAKGWLESIVNSDSQFGLAWLTIIGFIRIMTNPRAMQHPLPVKNALSVAESWLSLQNVSILEPGPRHGQILFRLVRQIGVAGNLTSDAHLAAIAIENQAQLASTDTDFARFPGLRWFNPL